MQKPGSSPSTRGIIRPAMLLSGACPDGSYGWEPARHADHVQYFLAFEELSIGMVYFLVVLRSQQGHTAQRAILCKRLAFGISATLLERDATHRIPQVRTITSLTRISPACMLHSISQTVVRPPRILWGFRRNICSASITTHPAHKPGLHDSYLHHYCSSGQC